MCSECKTLIDLIDTFNLRQNVVASTHRKGHTLILIFIRTDELQIFLSTLLSVI